MKYKILFYFYIVLSIGVIAKDTRIIGGTNADAREFAYTVSLRHTTENLIFCTGVIISHRSILTSAQCYFVYPEALHLIKIYPVRTRLPNFNGQSFTIEDFVVHPDFTGEMLPTSMNTNDIAVIKTVETIRYNRFQKMIHLPTENTQDGIDCVMSGWGSLTYPHHTIPWNLQKAVITIMNPYICSIQFSISMHLGQLCGSQRVEVKSSVGDGGAPLVCNDTLVGLASTKIPGFVESSEIFTDVYYYMDFILSTMTHN